MSSVFQFALVMDHFLTRKQCAKEAVVKEVHAEGNFKTLKMECTCNKESMSIQVQ